MVQAGQRTGWLGVGLGNVFERVERGLTGLDLRKERVFAFGAGVFDTRISHCFRQQEH